MFSGTNYLGERIAAGEARKRIKEKLQQLDSIEKSVEFRIPVQDHWSRHLFIALCRRYNIEPYRYSNQRQTTIMIKTPESFVRNILHPEYLELNKELHIYLRQITEQIIKEEIYDNIDEPKALENVIEL